MDPKTVRRYVAACDAGRPVTGPGRRPRIIDEHMPKIEEWVDRSEGKPRRRHPRPTYERRSLAVTSNIHLSGYDTIMPKTLATAAVDRVLHHAHVIITEGTSLSLAEATTGRGGIPLT